MSKAETKSAEETPEEMYDTAKDAAKNLEEHTWKHGRGCEYPDCELENVQAYVDGAVVSVTYHEEVDGWGYEISEIDGVEKDLGSEIDDYL